MRALLLLVTAASMAGACSVFSSAEETPVPAEAGAVESGAPDSAQDGAAPADAPLDAADAADAASATACPGATVKVNWDDMLPGGLFMNDGPAPKIENEAGRGNYASFSTGGDGGTFNNRLVYAATGDLTLLCMAALVRITNRTGAGFPGVLTLVTDTAGGTIGRDYAEMGLRLDKTTAQAYGAYTADAGTTGGFDQTTGSTAGWKRVRVLLTGVGTGQVSLDGATIGSGSVLQPGKSVASWKAYFGVRPDNFAAGDSLSVDIDDLEIEFH